MSIKIYDEKNKKWTVQGTTTAQELSIIDMGDNYDSTNVEGALREIAMSINASKVEAKALQEQVKKIDEDFTEHLVNHPSGGGGGGGGGNGTMPTISSTFEDGKIIEEGTEVRIPIFFSSPNLGEGSAYIMVNGIETKIVTVKQGNNTINIGVLTELKNQVSIYVKDRGGLMSNQLTWNIICGGLTATIDFDTDADYSVEDIIRMQYTIETASTEPIILNMTIDSNITQHTAEVGYNEFIFNNLSVGVHQISFYFESGVYKTKTFNFNIVVVDGANLYVSSTFTGGEFTFGVPINVPYRISKLSTENFAVRLMIDGEIDREITAPAGSYYWTIPKLAIGSHTLRIEAESIIGEFSFIELSLSIVEGEYEPVNPVTQGLVAWFDATSRSNQDSDKDYWFDKSGNGNVARLHNFNYHSNGWIDGKLKCDGDAYVEIDMTPYADNVKQGSTIDIMFKVENIGLEDARIIDYTGITTPYKGIYANVIESCLTSLTNTGKVTIDEDTETRLTFIIDRQNKFAKIYVNAVLCRAFYLSDSGSGTTATFEDFSHNEKIYINSRKGQDLFGKCEVSNVRVYNRALSSDEVLQNHIADITDLEKQRELYDFNYNNTTTPEIRLYGDTTNMTNENKVQMRVKYTSPNEDLYGQSFDQPYCLVNWQGTSSIAYVLKNYQIWLKDENMADWYYSPFNSGAKENVLTIKCD